MIKIQEKYNDNYVECMSCGEEIYDTEKYYIIWFGDVFMKSGHEIKICKECKKYIVKEIKIIDFIDSL